MDVPYKVVGLHGSSTSLSSVVSVTLNSQAQGILVQCFNQNVRYTLDGVDPSATRGFRITAAADPVLIPVVGGTVVKFIQEVSGAELQYQQVIGS